MIRANINIKNNADNKSMHILHISFIVPGLS